MRIYLDQNIYIAILDKKINKEELISYSQKNDIEFVYGPPHIEEVYRVASDASSPFKSKMPELMTVIKEVTGSREILPTLEGLIVKSESPEKCYNRIKEMDTTQRVENDSGIKFRADTANYKKMLDEDKHNQSISVLSPKDVWKNKTIEKAMAELNRDSANIIKRYNNSIEVNMLRICGCDRRLNESFNFERGVYHSRLQNCFNELEYMIEILMRVLNYYGYNAEKTERTAVSSTHDVTHCIYWTKSDYLITMDKRFSKKCEAVYEYIGADTNVIYYTNTDDFSSLLKKVNCKS